MRLYSQAYLAYNKKWIAEHRDQIKAGAKRYRLAHKEQLNAYWPLHRTKLKEYNKKYYSEHPEKIKNQSSAFYAAHKSQILESRKAYHLAHRIEIKVRSRKYYLEHRDQLAKSSALYANTPKGRDVIRKVKAKRRQFGFVPLNAWFTGAEGHHVTRDLVIYLPKVLHRSLYHELVNNINMEAINTVAYEFLNKVQTSN